MRLAIARRMLTTFVSSRALGTSIFSAALIAGALALPACGGDEAPPLTFQGNDPLFPGFDYDTGLLPAGSPVQASFRVLAEGDASVSAAAVPSEGDDGPTLTGTPGTGSLGVTGKFGLEGRLVIDVSGLPSYDGPIPGIENVAIEMAAASAFDPFSIGAPVTARADIPAAQLPPIPLPGGIPGSLILEVAEGSFVTVTMTGQRACASESTAEYVVGLERSGTVVIEPSIEIEIPLVGTQAFDIPAVEVPLSFDPTTLAMRAEIGELGAAPEGGDAISQACDGSGGSGASGGAGGGMGGATGGGSPDGGAGGGAMTCATRDDCGGLPCVEGTCSNGEGVCQAGITLGDTALDACVSASCCLELETCTFDYSDVDGCNACMEAYGGPRCDSLLACLGASCDVFTCDPAHYGSGDGCDCGCGVFDPDCADSSVGACAFCDTPGSCGSGPCPANIDPGDNAKCI
jgi:hypothetical protein